MDDLGTVKIEVNDLALGWPQAIETLFHSARRRGFAGMGHVEITEDGEPVDLTFLQNNFRVFFKDGRYSAIANNFNQIPRDFKVASRMELGVQNYGTLTRADKILKGSNFQGRVAKVTLQLADAHEEGEDPHGYVHLAPRVVLCFEYDEDYIYAKMKYS